VQDSLSLHTYTHTHTITHKHTHKQTQSHTHTHKISAELPLEKAGEAHDLVIEGHAGGKVILTI